MSLSLLISGVAFQPAMRVAVHTPAMAPVSLSMAEQGPLSRRAAVGTAAVAFFGALPAFADGEEAPAVVAPPPPPPPPKPMAQPAPYELKKNYPQDAKNMLDNMKVATELTRGAPDMENIVKKTRGEMNDFVAFYRRQPKVAGMPSFSTLYTAINTLSGHYASYGNKYPVPTKRKERLTQQYKEIERALARGK